MRIKKLLIFLIILTLVSVSATALGVTLDCPASVVIGSPLVCDLSFTESQSLMSFAGTFTITSSFASSVNSDVQFSNMPGSFTGIFAANTNRFSIDDLNTLAGTSGTVRIADLTFNPISIANNQRISILIDAGSTSDINLNPITLESLSVESGLISVVADTCVPSPATCLADEIVCDGSTPDQRITCDPGESCNAAGQCICTPVQETCSSTGIACDLTGATIIPPRNCDPGFQCVDQVCIPGCNERDPTECTDGVSCPGNGVIPATGCNGVCNAIDVCVPYDCGPAGDPCNDNNECTTASVCNEADTCVGSANAADGTVCSGGTCQSGVCVATGDTVGSRVDQAIRDENLDPAAPSVAESSWSARLISRIAAIFRSFFSG